MWRILAVFVCIMCPAVAGAQSFGEGALIDTAPHTAPTPDDQSIELHAHTGEQTVLVDALVDGVLAGVTSVTPYYVPTSFSSTGCPQQYYAAGDEHFLTRLNQSHGIAHQFVPSKLVNIQSHLSTRYNQVICLTAPAATAWLDLTQAAALWGLDFVVTSGYRSAYDQAALYHEYAPLYNTGAYHRVAKPGHSEHQLGTTLDIAGLSMGYQAGYAFGSSPEYRWMEQHAHEYGFINSYHKGAEHLTGYQHEPWHWRYVGREVAMLLHTFDHSLAFQADYRTPQAIVASLTQNMPLASASVSTEIGG